MTATHDTSLPDRAFGRAHLSRARPWLPIATAPKDQQILLLYRGHDQLPFVCQGRWVEWPHENIWMNALRSKRPLEPKDSEGHWEIGYVAVMVSSHGRFYTPCSGIVFPTHWQSLPRPPRRLPRGYSRHG